LLLLFKASVVPSSRLVVSNSNSNIIVFSVSVEVASTNSFHNHLRIAFFIAFSLIIIYSIDNWSISRRRTSLLLSDNSLYCFLLTLLCHRLSDSRLNQQSTMSFIIVCRRWQLLLYVISHNNLDLILKWAELGQFTIFLPINDNVWVLIGVVMNPGVKKVGRTDSGSRNKSIGMIYL